MSSAVERVDGLAVDRRPPAGPATHAPPVTVVTVPGAIDRAAFSTEVSRRLPELGVVR